ncbi:hypothetical protein EW026_g3639 [Hermanssonia centrifuga]|uniref:CLASP N-terminal domain-containing protein n=1 Tax=Hermanssonia centrifuga TaxID=98765 RepID=A0A4S4KJI5_9APHY|nr:hypothetical protein EW026_g3639 [Hermanssonia centrifuga]
MLFIDDRILQIADPDALVSVLKACLRTPNQHLTTATLGALPPLLPLLITRSAIGLGASTSSSPAASTSSLSASVIDVHTLRQVVHAFLPSGGVFDRLGDNRERARDKARETIVLLGGYAFRSSSIGSSMRAGGAKGPETPLMGFEKFLKELGLSSKVWRVREQAILTLVQIRRVHHLFPIRPYLPALVEALEDSDSTVRECAKQSVVELFTGPGVTDGARADLKKEMTKKNVRKNIVETVLARVLAGASVTTPLSMSEAGSENGDSTGGYVPPSVALKTKRPGIASGGGGMSRTASQVHVKEPSRPASRAAVVSPTPMEGVSTPGNSDVKSVYITSSRDLENEFASMLKHFDGKETEHNWAAREQAIMRVRGMLKGEVHERYPETFLQGLIQGFISASIKTLISLRTTVSSTTCSLYTELIIALGPALDPVCETLYTNLLRMASLTKKIVAQQSQTTVALLMNNTSAQPRLVLPLLWNGLQDKAIQTRLYIIGHVKTYLETHGTRARHAIEANGGVDTLDKCIRKGLADPNPGSATSGDLCGTHDFTSLEAPAISVTLY